MTSNNPAASLALAASALLASADAGVVTVTRLAGAPDPGPLPGRQRDPAGPPSPGALQPSWAPHRYLGIAKEQRLVGFLKPQMHDGMIASLAPELAAGAAGVVLHIDRIAGLTVQRHRHEPTAHLVAVVHARGVFLPYITSFVKGYAI